MSQRPDAFVLQDLEFGQRYDILVEGNVDADPEFASCSYNIIIQIFMTVDADDRLYGFFYILDGFFFRSIIAERQMVMIWSR